MFAAVLRCLGVLACLLAALPALAQNKIALVIGNAAYSSLPVLANPANDAILITDNLKTVGFTVTSLTDQSQAQMKSAIAAFSAQVEQAGSDTIAVFYYAGHGVQIDGTNYLVPVDASVKSASDVVLGSVSASDLLKTLELARAKVNVLVLDACRDNPFKGTTRGFARGLARVEAPAGSLVAYATAPGQVAQDGQTTNSPYATALAKYIATPGLALEEVFRKVRIDVSEDTQGAQVPWEETSLTQEIILSGAKAGPAVDDAPPVQNGNSEVDATRAYLVAVGQNSIEAYDKFLQQFPNAKETTQAMRNLELLNDEANWIKATTQNTVGAYRIYLNLHPDGGYVVEAKARLAALQSASAPPPPAASAETMIEAAGFDLFGTDSETLRNVTFESCSAACKASSTCAAVTYRADLQRCYMKSGVSLLVRNDTTAIAIKSTLQDKVRTVEFQMRPQTDLPGFDFADEKQDNAQACLLRCEAQSDCKAFAYVTSNRTCWLKNGFGQAVAAPPVVSGFRIQ
jgi:uncharacterized caspase-like protein